ncbi:hypothetical protein VNI00_003802 [Paramarasmius palmivorus]|uniref:F-box domain-containing protein n=1 Tax=Paramarasmius palmivorus TaxID=297713 RepID=A0AAW0DMQ2_9AGAR
MLTYDVIEQIIEALDLEDDLVTLTSYCLLNQEVYKRASMALYKILDFNVGEGMGPATPRCGRRAITHANQALYSACLPRNRHRVKKIAISGVSTNPFLGKYSLNNNTGSFVYARLQADLLADAFQLFDNIESIAFNVTSWSGFLNSRQIDPYCLQHTLRLLQCQGLTEKLRELLLNFEVCETDSVIKPLVHPNLRKLSLIDIPARDFDWFAITRPCSGLRELQLRSELYTSFDAGPRLMDSVERALMNLRNLRTLALGFLYTASDDHTFDVLSQLPQLENLCLEYRIIPRYRRSDPGFQGLPITFAPLRALKSFTLRYKEHDENAVYYRSIDICRWIKHVVSLSPLERLSYHPFYQPRTLNPKPKESWDLLVDHLADKHASTLRSLDLRAGFVRKRALRRLLVNCQQLEELSVATSRGALDSTFVHCARHVPRLLQARFELRTQRKDQKERNRITQVDEAERILKAALGLRRLIVNEEEFLGSWTLDEHRNLHYVTEKIE